MKKIIITCLLSLPLMYFAFSNANAQDVAKRNIDPPTQAEIVRTYINLANLTVAGRATALSNLSPETKEKFDQFQTALEIATRPELRSGYGYLLDTLNSSSVADRGSLRRRSFSEKIGNETVVRMLQKYIDVAGLNSESDRKKAFQTLVVDEKKGIWKTRLTLHLAFENFDWPKQMLVIELLSIIDDKPVYLESRDKKEMQAMYDYFEERARLLFGKADTYRLFMSLGNETGCVTTKASNIVGLYGDDFEEPVGSNCSCYYDTYCNLQNEWWLCVGGGCTQKSGCGVIFDTNCTGQCRAA